MYGHGKQVSRLFNGPSEEAVKRKIKNKYPYAFIHKIELAQGTPTLKEDDQIQNNMTNNVRDALMFLKMSGQKQVPVNMLFNEFKKRGVVVSLDQLKKMFPPGSNDLIKNITDQFVEFGDDGQSNNDPMNPQRSNKPSDEVVGDLANKAINKRM